MSGAAVRGARARGAGAIRFLLPAWFVLWSGLRILYLLRGGLGFVGLDARIYQNASAAWLNGTDPWEAFATFQIPFHFAGSPATIVVLSPFVVVPQPLFVAGWIALSVASAVFIVRRLGLPWWWLLFPPIVEGVIAGNPQVPLLALLLWGRAPGAFIATLLKPYAIFPDLIRLRWRQTLVAAGGILLTVAVVPNLWFDYFTRLPAISARLLVEAGGGFSAMISLPLAIVTAAALAWLFLSDLPWRARPGEDTDNSPVAIVRRLLRNDPSKAQSRAAWLAVPAIWPATQLHYSTFAMPVATPLLGLLLALPVPGMPALVVIGFAGVDLLRRTPAGARIVARAQVALGTLIAPAAVEEIGEA